MNASSRVSVVAMLAMLCTGVAQAVESTGAGAASSYTVETIAGAGTSGVRDGDARTAQFMKPIGIASDAQGFLYVADAAAQRIRLVAPNGTVTTLAGSGDPQFSGMWVEGGYKDGPALQAQFNRPSGIAVGPDGSVYVADTLNHCIRVVKDGLVHTYAGSPGDTSGADGAIGKASFIRPRALAFDAQGDLYVADYPLGIRRISHGAVTTLPLDFGPDKRFVSVAFSGSGSDQRLYVGTANELVVFDATLRALARRHVSGGTSLYGARGVLLRETVDSAQGLGPAFGVVASGTQIVVGDARSHAVRVLATEDAKGATDFPSLLPDAADYGGGFQDGGMSALFDTPMGLALMPGGAIAVADSGNRRIRKLTLISAVAQDPPARPRDIGATDSSQSGALVAGEDAFRPIGDRYYRIAYLGNSYAYFNTRWADSVPGRIEAGLQAKWKSYGLPKPPKLVSISPIATFSGFQEYIDNILSTGVVDAVILQVNSTNIAATFPHPKTDFANWGSYNAAWARPTEVFLKRTDATLRAQGIPLLVVANPVAAHLTPVELGVASEITGFQEWIYLTHGPPSGDDFETVMRRVLVRSGVRSVNLFPAFMAAEQSARRVPLYGTTDGHFSNYGRALAARVILDALVAKPMWKHVRKSAH